MFKSAPKEKTSGSRLVAASLVGLILLTSCGGNKQVRFSTLFKEDDELTANMAFKIVDKTYRIKPDKRYLLALSDISEILTGKPLEKVEAAFENGKWKVKSNKIDVTEINNFPSYSDITTSLINYSKSLEANQESKVFQSNKTNVLNHSKVFGDINAETHIVYTDKAKKAKDIADSTQKISGENDDKNSPLETDREALKIEDPVDAALIEYSPKSLFKAIELLNGRWKQDERVIQTLDQTATALTSLAFQMTDTAGTGDALFSKAMAYSALAKRYETTNANRNLARLADSMGYHVEAIAMAKNLPECDPFRIFMLWQARTIHAALEQGFDTNETRFLYVKKLAQEEDLEHDEKYQLNSDFSLPISGLMTESFKNQPFDTGKTNPDFAPLKSAILTGLQNSKSETKEGAFFPQFNANLKQLRSWEEQSKISQEMVSVFFRSFAYEYVLAYLRPVNGTRIEKDAEKLFDNEFGVPDEKEIGSTICAFAHGILESRTGHYHVAKLLGDAVNSKDLGDLPRFLAFNETSRWFPNGDQKLISAGKTIFENADSRPENRFRVAEIAHTELLHPVLAQTLNEHGFDVDFTSTLSVAAASEDVNHERLRRIAETKTRTPSQRAKAMLALCQLAGQSDSGAKELYAGQLAELVEKNPENFEVLKRYAQAAPLAKKTATAIANVKTWSEKNQHTQILVDKSNELLAALYFENGNTEETLKILEKEHGNELPAVTAEAYANALIKAGRKPQAEAFADSYYQTNRPSVSALALQAQMLWRKNAYSDAAVLLKSYPWHLKAEDWRRNIYPAFKQCFSGHAKETAAAVRALAKEGFTESADLGELAQAFAFYGENNTGFEVLNTVLSSSFSGHELSFLNLSTMAYMFLQKAENEKIALKWIQERVPPQFFTPLAMFAFQNGAYPILWTLVPPNPEGIGSEYVWLTRAAAMPMQKGLTREQNQQIIQHFSKNDNDALFQIGKCLIGVMDSKQLMDKRINVRELCDLSYFLGSHDAYMGDQKAAAIWYHMALETGMNKADETARNAEAIRRLTQYYPDWSERQ